MPGVHGCRLNHDLRDVHEYLLVFAKWIQPPDRGESDISREEFMSGTLSVWNIAPESAKKKYPSPFPVELAERVIKLFSYTDVILDPLLDRVPHVSLGFERPFYVSYDIVHDYCELAKRE